jgi:guanine deaminase
MTDRTRDDALLREAIALARRSVAEGGGPFGAIVVRGSEILGRGTNRVTIDNDPTAHAEICAIRAACKTLGSFRLDGCSVYASCEPCPMCMAALRWARVERLVFGASTADAAAAGFDDERFQRELGSVSSASSVLPGEQMLRDEALAPFRDWAAKPDRRPY